MELAAVRSQRANAKQQQDPRKGLSNDSLTHNDSTGGRGFSRSLRGRVYGGAVGQTFITPTYGARWIARCRLPAAAMCSLYQLHSFRVSRVMRRGHVHTIVA